MKEGITCDECGIKTNCLVNTLNEFEYEVMLKNKTSISIESDDVLYGAGRRSSEIAIVQNGWLKVEKNTGKGDNVVLFRFQGGMVGFESLVDGARFKIKVSAVKKSNICLFPIKVVQDIMLNNKETFGYVIEAMLELMDATFVKNNDITQLSLKSQIAKVLYDISEHFSSFTLKREVFASYIGGSRESISRILGEFKNDEIVDLRRSIIVVKNRKALQNQFVKFS